MTHLVLLLQLFAVPLADTAPATRPAVQSSAAQVAAARAEFDGLFRQWKKLLAELGDLRQQYGNAAGDRQQRKQFSERYFQLTKDGDALLAKLVAAASKTFVAGGGSDSALGQFLLEVARDAESRDNYEVAAPVARMLVDHGARQPQLVELAGIASFHIHDFDAAEKYLRQAAKNRPLSKNAQHVVQQLDYERKAWQREQPLRAAEAKSDDLPRVKLETRYGDIVVELFENEAPNTVANFVSLVDKGFYNGLTFHRVLPAFMAQGGCPKGNGTGGPGYMIRGEAGDEKVYRRHFRGSISMALGDDPDSGGSQFFITFVPTNGLDGKHTVFGRVIEGMNVLSRIKRRDPENPIAEGDTILKATVIRKRPHPYEPQKIEKPPQ